MLTPVTTIEGGVEHYVDESPSLQNGTAYEYQLVAQPADPSLDSDVSDAASPSPDWIDTTKLNVLIVTSLFFVVLFYRIHEAHRGKRWTFRTIPGLDAIEEAIGRATEMGTPGAVHPRGSRTSTTSRRSPGRDPARERRADQRPKYETADQGRRPYPLAVFTMAEEMVRSGYLSDVGRPTRDQAEPVRSSHAGAVRVRGGGRAA